MERLHRDSKVSEAPQVDAVVQRREEPGASAAGPAAAPRADVADAEAGEHGEGGQGAWEADDSFLSAAGLDTSNKEGGKGDAEVPPWVKQGSMDPDSKAPRGDGKATEAVPVPPAKQGADAARPGGDAAKQGDAASGPDKDAGAAKPEAADASGAAAEEGFADDAGVAEAAPGGDAGEVPADDEVGVATVQRKESGDSTGDVHAAASSGIGGPSTTLPHLDAIQASFGHHDVSGVAAHTDGQAAAANQAMGAEAFATGNHVAFDGGAPSLHTAAHEAAHVVQQRGGVQLKGGVGEAGDSWEQHADAVADRVVAGESAQALLDPVAGGTGAAAADGPVQQKGKPFVPKISLEGSHTAINLNEALTNTFQISNVKAAPKGTTYSWTVREQTQSKAFGPTVLGGFNTPVATFASDTREVTKGQAKFIIELTVTSPDGTATKHDAPTWTVQVAEPTFTFTNKVTPGPGGGGTGPGNLRPGDTLDIRVNIGGVSKPQFYFSLFPGFMPPVSVGTFLNEVSKTPTNHEMPFEVAGHKWEGDELVYTVKTHHAGKASMLYVAALPGAAPFQKTFDLMCKSTMKQFRDRLDLAPHRHEALVSLYEGYLERCFRSYKTGYENAKAALDAQARREQLTRDILLGVLFAGLGGAAGGAVGSLVSNALKPSQAWVDAASKIQKAVQGAAAGAATDAAKDVVKYSVRVFPKLGGGTVSSGGGAGGGTEWGPDPSSAGNATGEAAAGVDPHDWISVVREAKDKEVATVKESFLQMKQAADDAIANGDNRLIENDPVNDITSMTRVGGKLITDFASAPAPASEEYEKGMWEAWIAVYGFKFESAGGSAYSDSYTVAKDNIGKDLRKEMDRIAKLLEQKGIDSSWLQAAIDQAKKRADAEAAAM